MSSRKASRARSRSARGGRTASSAGRAYESKSERGSALSGASGRRRAGAGSLTCWDLSAIDVLDGSSSLAHDAFAEARLAMQLDHDSSPILLGDIPLGVP